jgi:hypothetical protein
MTAAMPDFALIRVLIGTGASPQRTATSERQKS